MNKQLFEPVRIGVVGLGAFGRLHAMTLTALVEAKLVALVDAQPEHTAALAGGLGDVPEWCDLEEAVAQAGAEAWVVASSTASHVTVTQALLRTGASVLVEKPLATDLAEAETLAPWVREDPPNLMVGHISLFNSEFRQLRHEVSTRPPIRLIDAVRHRSTNHVDLYPSESPLRLLMVHDLYQTQILTGGREPVSMSARSGRRRDGADNVAVAELVWEDGMMARLTASFLGPEAMGSQGFDRLEVFAEDWGARLNPNPRPIELWTDRVHWPLTLEMYSCATAPTGMLAEQLRCFCRVVRKQEPVPIGARYVDAMQIMRWLDQLEKSANDGGISRAH